MSLYLSHLGSLRCILSSWHLLGITLRVKKKKQPIKDVERWPFKQVLFLPMFGAQNHVEWVTIAFNFSSRELRSSSSLLKGQKHTHTQHNAHTINNIFLKEKNPISRRFRKSNWQWAVFGRRSWAEAVSCHITLPVTEDSTGPPLNLFPTTA